MTPAVNVFDTLATGKAVSGVTFRAAATSASPATPRQVVPSGKRIAAEIPGMPDFALRASSLVSSAVRSMGVAVVRPRCGIEYGRTPTSSAGVCGAGSATAGEGVAASGVACGAAAEGLMAGLPGGVAVAAATDPRAAVVVTGVSMGAAGDGIASHVPTAAAARARAMTGRRAGRITRGRGAT